LHFEKPCPLSDEDPRDKTLLSNPQGALINAQSLEIENHRNFLQLHAVPG